MFQSKNLSKHVGFLLKLHTNTKKLDNFDHLIIYFLHSLIAHDNEKLRLYKTNCNRYLPIFLNPMYTRKAVRSFGACVWVDNSVGTHFNSYTCCYIDEQTG